MDAASKVDEVLVVAAANEFLQTGYHCLPLGPGIHGLASLFQQVIWKIQCSAHAP
jgi:hypothetical protein